MKKIISEERLLSLIKESIKRRLFEAVNIVLPSEDEVIDYLRTTYPDGIDLGEILEWDARGGELPIEIDGKDYSLFLEWKITYKYNFAFKYGGDSYEDLNEPEWDINFIITGASLYDESGNGGELSLDFCRNIPCKIEANEYYQAKRLIDQAEEMSNN